MKQSFKIAILVLTLVVPALVYVFLKSFGENRYALPFFYQDEIAVAGCADFTSPHSVDLAGVDFADRQFTFLLISDKPEADKVKALNRIVTKFDGGRLVILRSDTSDVHELDTRLFSREKLDSIASCILFLEQNFDSDVQMEDRIVLVDRNHHIRGYYNIDEFDELERVDVEIKILLQEYSY